MSRLLIPVLLCGLCVCVCASDQRDYGVKLCGREFIRAVIFTCGGSRWRRSIHPLTPDNPNPPISGQGPGGLGRFGSKRAVPWERSSRLSSSSSLSDLLQLVGEQTDPRDDAGPGSAPSSSWAVWSLDLSGPDRRRRNFSHGLAGLCCSQGCTKNDIGRLC